MATASKPKCKYWEKCYQKDPAHKKKFLHPTDADASGSKSDSDGEDLEDMSGTKVVFTGSLSNMTRKVAAAEAAKYGIITLASISGKADLVVVGDGGGQKISRAEDLGITQLTEDEWFDLIKKAKPIKSTKQKADSPKKSPAKTGQKRAATTHDISDSEDDTEDEGTPAKKKAKKEDSDSEEDSEQKTTTVNKGKKPRCSYWPKCYRKNPAHLKQFAHPPITDKVKAAAAKAADADDDDEEMDVDGGADEPMEEDGESAEPKNVLADGATVDVVIGGSTYRVKRTGDSYYCTCAGWKFQKGPIDSRTCRHLRDYLGSSFEDARCGTTTTSSGRVSRPPVQLKHKNIGQLLLAHKWTESVSPNGWWLSEKLDGVRAYWDGRTFYSRLGNEFRPPKWFIKDFPTDMTLDGELFGGRGKFQSTVSIVKTPENDRWKNIKYYVFDTPSMARQPFEDRMEVIKEYFDENKVSTVHVLEQERCKNVAHLNEELKRVEGLGGEGLMIRKPKSQYEHGRSHTLLKIKTFHDAEAVVIGHDPGKGRNANVCGALVCKMECGNVFRVGSGLSDADRRKPPKKGSIITYKFQELTNSGVPRFPSYLGVRIDAAGPKDAVLPPKPSDG